MLRRLQWVTVGLLFTGGLINYMDRAVFGVLAPLISEELQLDPAQLGLALSVFSFGYTAFCFLGGWAADRFGSRRTLAVSMTFWSVICGLIGTASSLPGLLVLRALFGVGESPWISSANKVLMRWFPKERYTSAFGLASSGQPLGGVVAGPLVGLVAAFFGWRAVFFVVAAIGLAWVVAWLFLAADTPEEHPRLDGPGRAEVRSMRERETAAAPEVAGGLGTALRQPKLLVTSGCFLCYSYMLFFFLSWFPSYLTMALHLDTATMGIVSAFPWALGAVGLISGGFLCDWMTRTVGDPLKAHKMVLVTGLLLTAVCVALCGMTASPTLAVALMAAGVGFLYLTGPTYYAIGLEGVPKESLGAVGGFMIFFVNIGGILAPLVTGYIVKGTGSFVGAFVLAAALVVIGALAVAFFARHPAADRAVASGAPSLETKRA